MNEPRVQSLVLDAGPLLSLAPLRGLSQSYYTVPQVLGELKDEKARSHFQNLGLSAGVKVEVRVPDAHALKEVTLASKKSGDYAVLSIADLHVIALTYTIHQEHESRKAKEYEAASKEIEKVEKEIKEIQKDNKEDNIATDGVLGDEEKPTSSEETDPGADKLAENFKRLPLDEPIDLSTTNATEPSIPPLEEPLYDDPTSSDDGQGEWITPSNVALHKSRALDLLPGYTKGKPRSKEKVEGRVDVACMSADYAVQNVLMHLGLGLVGVEGTRIKSVKSWVLRCHACFKICKDSTKKFCPTCGNATLLRTSISTTASTIPGQPPKVEIHLKPNFQYRTRGTKYSIPMPKPGTSKAGSGTGLILREDQREYQKAVEKEQKREERERERLMKAALDGQGKGSVKVGNWDDPDWVPGILLGEDRKGSGGFPTIGMGRKNPNERRRKR